MSSILEKTPGFVEPMECLSVPSVPTDEGWLYEIEWEGRRVIGSKKGQMLHLFSETGECLDKEFPEILAGLAGLNCRSAIVDGKVIAWDEEGRPSRRELRKRNGVRVLHMAVFDLLMLEDRDLREKPLELRRAALAAILPPEGGSMMSYSRELQGQPDMLLERAKELRIAGIIAKQRDSQYESGKCSGAWLKCQPEEEGAFLIGGYVPGDSGFDELVIGERKGGKFCFVARLRSGFLAATRRNVFMAVNGSEQTYCPFAGLRAEGNDARGAALDADTMKRCRWVSPRVSVDVAFAGWTPQGRLRYPRFTGLSPA